MKIRELFTSEGLLEKKAGVWVNKPGIINLESDDPKMLRHFADFMSRLGLEISGIQFPLIGDHEENALSVRVDNNLSSGEFKWEKVNGGFRLSGHDHDALSKGIETCILDGDIEEGESQAYKNITERLKTTCDFRILWDDGWAVSPEASLEIFLRIGMDSFKGCYPYALTQEDVKKGGDCNVKLIKLDKSAGSEKRTLILFDENGNILVRPGYDYVGAAGSFAFDYSMIRDIQDDGWIKDFSDAVSGINDLGQMAEIWRRSHEEEDADLTLITKNNSKAIIDREKYREAILSKYKKEITLGRHNDGREISAWSFNESWEGDYLINQVREVLPVISSGDEIEVKGLLSEDRDMRNLLENKIRELINEAGATCKDVKIYRTFKSGLSWIEERVIPALKEQSSKGPIDKVIIEFSYFLNEDGDDRFEDESIPNYGVHEDKPNKWFDIPTRWLQELYPVDEIISAELGISKDKVEFKKVDGDCPTYNLIAFSSGQEVWRGDFDAKYIKKHYMEKYPGIGWTHVSTGHLEIKRNGRIIADEIIETDMEKLWKHLEGEVLPEIMDYLLSKYQCRDNQRALLEKQPLFSRLNIDIDISEMDYDLGIRNERISMLESMQEDIYFYILDWFKTYGERECGGALDNIGLIVPSPENRKGEGPSMTISLWEERDENECLVVGDSKNEIPHINVSARLKSYSLSTEKISELDIQVKSEEEDIDDLNGRIESIRELIERGIAIYPSQDNLNIKVSYPGGEVEALIPEYKRPPSEISESEIREMINYRVLDYDSYMKVLDYYSEYPELRVIPVGTTYKGRKIYGIEIVRKDPEIAYSRYKLMNSRITILFNARHHGNEATGLNSAFMLIDELFKREDLNGLLDRVNIISVPYENIDGGEMHCEIISKHPHWLAHIARYNSAGFEFRKDYGNKDTQYGEAKAIRELWEKWLPDMITDNHGFEGHEMCQPFSGYISPWYKSFWIPRAQYYGYIWYDSNVEHLEACGVKVRESVTEAIKGDPEISSLNEIYADRFDKYARNWFPDLFVSTKYNDVVFYWMDNALHPRPNNFAIRNPEITVLDWTTEVADETVQGEEFYLNARAHLISDLALLEVIKDVEMEYDECKTGNNLVKIRRKPLIV